ncbi:hypothetical protein, partial [Intestinimonas sp.]|uniref:hypothetical protein n=1 Tax=Intestinimonas sp. TaxID=1965293 RepID=UPI003AB875B2
CSSILLVQAQNARHKRGIREHEINLNFLHEKLAIKQEELIKTFSGMSPDKVAVSENTATMPPEVQVG